MKYLLDTNACIHLLNEPASALAIRYPQMPKSDIHICSVVKAELVFGAWNSKHRDLNLAKIQEFWAPLKSLPFDDAAADAWGQIRASLKERGQIIGLNDMLIAAIALANNLTVVTHNISEFGRVDGLRVEDWEA